MTVDVTSYQDAFANFDKGLAILNLIQPLEAGITGWTGRIWSLNFLPKGLYQVR